jgi:hypothetical protein
MTRTLKASAIAAALVVTTVSSAFANNTAQATIDELKFLGYSDEVVNQLSSEELNIIESAMHNGSDSDAIENVNSWVFHFTG